MLAKKAFLHEPTMTSSTMQRELETLTRVLNTLKPNYIFITVESCPNSFRIDLKTPLKEEITSLFRTAAPQVQSISILHVDGHTETRKYRNIPDTALCFSIDELKAGTASMTLHLKRDAQCPDTREDVITSLETRIQGLQRSLAETESTTHPMLFCVTPQEGLHDEQAAFMATFRAL